MCVWMCVVSAWTSITVLLLVPIKPAKYCILCVCVYRTILTLHVCLIGQMADCHHVIKMHGAAFIGLWKCYRFLSCSGLHQVSTALFFYPKKRLMIISCAANWNWVLSAFSHHDCFCFFHKRKFLSLGLTCAHSLTGATHFLVGKLS